MVSSFSSLINDPLLLHGNTFAALQVISSVRCFTTVVVCLRLLTSQRSAEGRVGLAVAVGSYCIGPHGFTPAAACGCAPDLQVPITPLLVCTYSSALIQVRAGE